MEKKKIKVGFDFDGVIAYNPLRVFRLPMSVVAKILKREKDITFYCPKSKLEKWIWILVHESSFFPAIGLPKLKQMLDTGRIEGYLLTSRYSCLEKSFYRWLTKHRIDTSFKGYFLNKKNEQPHKFKEQIIKRLELDFYLDDNWDIVNYLSSKLQIPNSKNSKQWNNVEIHWIYNIVDRFNPYLYKHPYLERFLEYIERKCKL